MAEDLVERRRSEIWNEIREDVVEKGRKPKSRCRTIEDTMEFIFTLLPAEKVDEIKAKRGECKSMEDVINLFPGVYGPVLRLRYAHDKRLELIGHGG